MNIAFLLGLYPGYGGVEIVTTVLANEFQRRGHIVQILSFKSAAPELLDQLNPEIVIHKLEFPVLAKRNILKLRSIVRHEQVDFLINQWCLPFSVTLLCRRAMKGTTCKLLAVHHNSPDRNAYIANAEIWKSKHEGSFFGRWAGILQLFAIRMATRMSLRLVYRYTDRYIVLSKAFLNVFSEFVGVRYRSGLQVITNPVTLDLDGFVYDSNQKSKTLLYVGRIDHNQKRVYRIIEIWEELYHRHPEWSLELVGDGPERRALEKLVTAQRIPRVTFHGFDEPISYYKAASMLMLTSDYEGFPLVLAEAMSCGVVPCVYGSYNAVNDIIDDGYNGLIIQPPFSSKLFAEKMDALMSDQYRRTRMAIAALEKVKAFSLEQVSEEWESLFTIVQSKNVT